LPCCALFLTYTLALRKRANKNCRLCQVDTCIFRMEAFLQNFEPNGPAVYHALLELVQECKCPICLEFFTEPRNAPCQHNFCEACIYEHIKDHHSECPTCRHPGVNKRSLAKNNMLANVTAIVKKLTMKLGISRIVRKNLSQGLDDDVLHKETPQNLNARPPGKRYGHRKPQPAKKSMNNAPHTDLDPKERTSLNNTGALSENGGSSPSAKDGNPRQAERSTVTPEDSQPKHGNNSTFQKEEAEFESSMKRSRKPPGDRESVRNSFLDGDSLYLVDFGASLEIPSFPSEPERTQGGSKLPARHHSCHSMDEDTPAVSSAPGSAPCKRKRGSVLGQEADLQRPAGGERETPPAPSAAHSPHGDASIDVPPVPTCVPQASCGPGGTTPSARRCSAARTAEARPPHSPADGRAGRAAGAEGACRRERTPSASPERGIRPAPCLPSPRALDVAFRTVDGRCRPPAPDGAGARGPPRQRADPSDGRGSPVRDGGAAQGGDATSGGKLTRSQVRGPQRAAHRRRAAPSSPPPSRRRTAARARRCPPRPPPARLPRRLPSLSAAPRLRSPAAPTRRRRQDAGPVFLLTGFAEREHLDASAVLQRAGGRCRRCGAALPMPPARGSGGVRPRAAPGRRAAVRRRLGTGRRRGLGEGRLSDLRMEGGRWGGRRETRGAGRGRHTRGGGWGEGRARGWEGSGRAEQRGAAPGRHARRPARDPRGGPRRRRRRPAGSSTSR
jgi:hypothetical protein